MVEASDLFIVDRLLLMNLLVRKERGKTSRKIRETGSTVVTAGCLAMSSFEL